MASKARKKQVNPASVPAEEGTSSSGAWRPEVDTEREFNPFVNPTVEAEVHTQIGESAWAPAPAEQSSEAAPQRVSRKRRTGRTAGPRKAKGSGAVAKRPKTKTKTRGKGKRRPAVRARGTKSSRRSARSRSVKRRS
jgi:hypothetical protein